MPDEDAPEMFIPNTSVLQIVPSKTDTELAAEFKRRMAECYEPTLRLFDEIKVAGFDCAISAGMGPLGKHIITVLRVIKEF